MTIARPTLDPEPDDSSADFTLFMTATPEVAERLERSIADAQKASEK